MSVSVVRVLNLFTIMNRGGAETMVMNYYRHFDRTKLQFDFMVHREERGAYDDEIEALGGKIYRMPAIRPWTSFAYKKQISHFYAYHPEYQIIHSHMSELGYYDFKEAERAGMPVRIAHAHNRPHGIDLKSPMRWYYKTRMKPLLTHMFMCGKESGEWLFGKKNQDKFIMLNNAIDTEKYVFQPSVRREVREKLGLNNKFVIGHVGRFDAQKNHSFIIEIFCEVLKKRPDAVLMLIGNDSGLISERIHSMVEQFGITDKVLFLGVRSDVADLMQAMDMFLFPSLFEGFGIAVLEAQASGLPCVVSKCIPDECIVTDLVSRLDVQQDEVSWANHLVNIKCDERMNTSRQIIESGFDIKDNAKWLQDFYLTCVNGE